MTETKIPEDGSSAVVLIDRNGVIRYLDEFGQLHRDGDLPAYIDNDGQIMYYRHGSIHRDGDLPAIISPNQESYYENGVRHRDKGPAVITSYTVNGTKIISSQLYYKEGNLHRDNGPAILFETGTYQHYKNGLRHNENGPACHWVTEDKTTDEYYLNGELVSKFAHKLYNMRKNILSKSSNKIGLKSV